MPDDSLDRATPLRSAAVGASSLLLGGALAGCGRASTISGRQEEDAQGGAAARRKLLIAYFSRAGENYYHGGIPPKCRGAAGNRLRGPHFGGIRRNACT